MSGTWAELFPPLGPVFLFRSTEKGRQPSAGGGSVDSGILSELMPDRDVSQADTGHGVVGGGLGGCVRGQQYLLLAQGPRSEVK